jgi:hypothetical protein
MPQKFALYDKNDKLYLITSNGATANDTFYNVLGTATILFANCLTDHELNTLTLQQAIDLKKTRKGIR